MLEFIVELTTVLIWIFGCATITLLAVIGGHECWQAGQQSREEAAVDKKFDKIVRH